MAKGLRGFQNEHKTNLGNKHSKKTKDKISKSHKNKKLSKEHKRNIRNREYWTNYFNQ